MSSSSQLGSRAPPPPLPPRPSTISRPAPAPAAPAIQETPATPTRASADAAIAATAPFGLVPPPSPSFVPASPSNHRYPSQSGAAGSMAMASGSPFPNETDEGSLLPPPPAYSPVPQPGESTLPPDHSPLLAPVQPPAAPPTQPSFRSSVPQAASAADIDPNPAFIPSLVSTLVPLLRSPTSYLHAIHPLPNLLYMSGSRLVLSPLSGSHLWHTSSPLSLHILTLPRNPTSTAAGTISITILPLIPTHDSSSDGLLSTLVQLATALHLKQYYFNATLSAPHHDSVALTYHNPALSGNPHPPVARVSLNAQLDDKKDARTGKTPRRTYCALHVPSVALSDEWVRHNRAGGEGRAVLVVYADCHGGMLETNVVGGAVRAMLASAVVL